MDIKMCDFDYISLEYKKKQLLQRDSTMHVLSLELKGFMN
jgi:hypothetical protein